MRHFVRAYEPSKTSVQCLSRTSQGAIVNTFAAAGSIVQILIAVTVNPLVDHC